ncbi:MAG: PAS-domain containing protein, partial [Pseudomonadota bacterium]|nr:PAS-domain containing protein [Pseudomonadota bacterium]
MQQGWLVVAAALAYIGLLFAIASYGDRLAVRRGGPKARPTLYALSLGVYCTSWTFFGSVGLAAGSGFDFLTIYIGPALLFGLGLPIVRRIAELAKTHNITSTADFIAARHGKSQAVAAVVTLIAVIGSIPYIALQLKAVSSSLTTLAGGTAQTPVFGDIALLTALSLAAFAILFGTRHVDATEHQEGLMLAIAAESIVKLLAFLAVGLFVVFGMFDGFGDLWAKAEETGVAPRVLRDLDGGQWIAMTLLSFICALALPRQFHVAIVENNSPREIRRAAWLFPLYLVLINLFVVPIALAGLMVFPRSSGVVSDMFVLSLPLSAGQTAITFAAFIGGLSAATAMVIVETVALGIMISNDLVIPALLKRRPSEIERADIGARLLLVRRAAILLLVLLAYVYYRAVGNVDALASIGLLSFSAVAQVGPALFGGLIWRRATARGAIAGMSAGISVWAYTMLLPTFIKAGVLPQSLLLDGPFGIAFLKPQMLFYIGFEPLVHSVFWSLSVNIAAYVLVSLLRAPEPIEQVQASLFAPSHLAPMAPSLRRWRSSVTVEELRATVARYLGDERTARSFSSFAALSGLPLRPHAEADPHLLRHAERLLASAVGAASSRLVLSLLLSRGNVSHKAALRLLDDASAAIQYSHDLLQTAIDHVRQGIAVFDPDLRLICWNRQFRELLNLPPSLGQVGTPLADIVRFNAERGDYGEGPVERQVAERLDKLLLRPETFQERLLASGMVLEVRTARLPDGGLVATYTDVTDKARAAEALALANETLERRVRERTDELMRINAELQRAKAAAEEANLGKTRFLAAASHDILQPLNAARLYASSLVERGGGVELARNIDSSLEAVEEILGALLDISRLDTGALKPEVASFRLNDLLRQVGVDFEPLARAKGLELRVVPCSLTIRSDRRLLRRMLQNLVSNAVKYTPSGR